MPASANRSVYLMDQPRALDRAVFMDCLFEGIQNEPRMWGGAGVDDVTAPRRHRRAKVGL